MVRRAKLQFVEQKESSLLRLDLGCGRGAATPDGFKKVDKIRYAGVDQVADLAKMWPWKSNSVDEVFCSYVLQFLGAEDRKFFVNELHRVLKQGGSAKIIVPHWCAHKAYAEVDVAWPPIAEGWFMSLNAAIRNAQNSEIRGYTCDFDVSVNYGMHPEFISRNAEYQRTAISYWREAAQDIHAVLTKK